MVVGGGAYLHQQNMLPDYLSKGEKANENETLSDEQVTALVAEVSKLIYVPDEQPSVATVTDADTLKATQPFFKDASDGDRLLIFPQAAKAVIYSEQEQRLVNVGPIQADSQLAPQTVQPVEEKTAQQQEELSIEVRNGTAVPGKGGETANRLEAASSSFVISEISNAAGTYRTTRVIDLGRSDATASITAVANTLGVDGVETRLPSGEPASDADILVLVGGVEEETAPE